MQQVDGALADGRLLGRVAALLSMAPSTPARVRTWRPTMTFSSAVMLPNRRMFWKVRAMPRSAAWCGASATSGAPSKTKPPPSGT
jgi:hypothetical protein